MKILMLGWEYPPIITGGLGIASQGLAEALAASGNEVTFLLPKKNKSQVSKNIKLLDATKFKPDFDLWRKEKHHIEFLQEVEIGKLLLPYLSAQTFINAREKQKVVKTLEETEESRLLDQLELTGTYSENLHSELLKYALLAAQVAGEGNYDLIHAHDWLTFKAGKMAGRLIGKPYVAHLHSTEFDRNGMHAQSFVMDEEKDGLEQADHVFCVSTKLKQAISEHYGISGEKVTVAPNGIDLKSHSGSSKRKPKHIAFIGRLTHQKSPARVIDIARELTSKGCDFTFSIIGEGYLQGELEEKVRRLNLTSQVRFNGFLERSSLLKKLSTIDLLIVPSLSEPFGLVILEAIKKHIPVAAAKNVGIAEFITSLPQADHWDTFTYCQLVEKLMTDDSYRSGIVKKCSEEAKGLTWKATAKVVNAAYKQL